MALNSFVYLIICISVSFIGSVQSEDPELTEFGKKVKKGLSEEAYLKVFAVNAETDEELKEAIEAASKKFAELLGFTVPEGDEKEAENENVELGIDHFTRSVNFHCQTYGYSVGLQKLGRLNSTNIDDLAQKFIDAYEKVAKTLDKDDLTSTMVAEVTADANFLKAVGETSYASVKVITDAYEKELKKYISKPGLVDTVVEDLL